jgi:hypothetical protein
VYPGGEELEEQSNRCARDMEEEETNREKMQRRGTLTRPPLGARRFSRGLHQSFDSQSPLRVCKANNQRHRGRNVLNHS